MMITLVEMERTSRNVQNAQGNVHRPVKPSTFGVQYTVNGAYGAPVSHRSSTSEAHGYHLSGPGRSMTSSQGLLEGFENSLTVDRGKYMSATIN